MFISGTRLTCLSFPASLSWVFSARHAHIGLLCWRQLGLSSTLGVSGHWVKCPEARDRCRLPGEGPRHVAWCWVSVTSPPPAEQACPDQAPGPELIQRRGFPQREHRGSLQVPWRVPAACGGQGPGCECRTSLLSSVPELGLWALLPPHMKGWNEPHQHPHLT